MNETNPIETWQIEVGGQIYEAGFDEMTQWVFEGSLLPQDKVRRGNLRWIEAGKVPSLIKFFNAKEKGEPPPAVITTEIGNDAPQTEIFAAPNHSNAPAFNNFSDNPPKPAISPIQFRNIQQDEQAQIAEVCSLHPEVSTAFFCETCGNSFCKICPKSYGGNVKICPFCGSMCQPVAKMRENSERVSQRRTANGEGFGFADFGRALAHPFKYKASLFFGAGLFMFLSFGQAAGGIGGIFMLSAALICLMLANMLTFGILSNTISNFSQGRLNTDFMPRFDDFSVWDDVIHPFFLSIGAYLSSFGPFILVCIVGVYLVFSSISAQNKEVQARIEQIPGTNYYDATRTVQQSDEVKKLLDGVREQNKQRLNQQQQIEQGNLPTVDDTEKSVMQADETIREMRKQQLDSEIGQSPESEQAQTRQILRGVLGLAVPIIVAGFLALLWGIFYFPAACAVAGYTQSFAAAINPTVGLDTIRRLGFDYVKILAMFIAIGVCSVSVSLILNAVLSPFDLPKIGNVPVLIVGSFFTFYFSIVFSCILGYAIFKNADKLRIYRG